MNSNLRIKSSLADDEVQSKVQGLLGSIALNFGSQLSQIGYLAHRKPDTTTILLSLDFHEDNDLVLSFCTSLMSPACDHLLCSLSEYGLLGFSPTEAIADTWHMALMKTIYICGAEVMENPQRKALSLKSKELIPVWFQVASLVSGTFIEKCFSLNPALQKLDIAAAESMLSKQESAKASANLAGEWSQKRAMQILKMLTKEKSAGISDEEKQKAAFSALKTFFISLDKATRTLKTMIQSGTVTMDKQRIAFIELYAVTIDATAAFTANEDMIEVYRLWAIKHAVSAVGNGTAAIMAFRKAAAFNTARANATQLSNNAAAAARAVPADNVFMQAGRWLSIVKSPPPEVVRQQLTKQAAELGQKATILGGKTLFSAFTTAITIGFVIRDVVQIVTVKSKLDYSKAVAELILQTWTCAAEINTLFRFVHVSGDGFQFETNGGHDWEVFLMQKLNRAPHEEWKRPDFVKLYLKDRWIYLDKTKKDLDAKLTSLYL